MSARATIARHPIHPMLVTVPIGLVLFGFVCDVAYLASTDPRWDIVAFYVFAGALVGALVAAVPGFMDYAGLKEPRVRRIARHHMLLNLVVVAMVAGTLWSRWSLDPGSLVPYVFSALAVAVLAVSGWLGGELVHIHGVSLERPVEKR